MAEEGEDGEERRKNVKLFPGQHGPSIWRDQMEIGNPLREGLSAFSPSIQCVHILSPLHST